MNHYCRNCGVPLNGARVCPNCKTVVVDKRVVLDSNGNVIINQPVRNVPINPDLVDNNTINRTPVEPVDPKKVNQSILLVFLFFLLSIALRFIKIFSEGVLSFVPSGCFIISVILLIRANIMYKNNKTVTDATVVFGGVLTFLTVVTIVFVVIAAIVFILFIYACLTSIQGCPG